MKTDPPVFNDLFYVDKIQFEHHEPFYVVRECVTKSVFTMWNTGTGTMFLPLDDTDRSSIINGFCCHTSGAATNLLSKLTEDSRDGR